ncbi:DUF2339 domain-containing protein [Pseudonocardia spinosispora]|uniref:DUF2339 domain-containing protein n=1 Tax=Pseudonocardia spinosispora TaxID=103441 RepID=UPI0003F90A23|nr:DUF2339 domain-containing protein [Pseudonocardia spinosispora]
MAHTPLDTHELAGLANELAELTGRLDRARAEVASWAARAEPEIERVTESDQPHSRPGLPPVSDSGSGEGRRGERPQPASPTVRAAAEATTSVRPADDGGSARNGPESAVNILAWVGGAITLVGVVLFLALAASRGWFGVPLRLALGGALGLALVGIGARLHRREDGRAGALALAATGIAALYLDVGTATAKYDYLPHALGLALGLLVAVAGIALADRWRSELLACGVVVGVGLMLPFVNDGPLALLVALVLVPQVAAVPSVVRRGWTWLGLVASVFPVLYGWVAVFGALLSESNDRAPSTTVLLAVFAVGAALAVLSARGVTEARAVGFSAARLVAAPLPALGMAQDWYGWQGAVLAGSVGCVLLAIAGLGGRLGLPKPVAVAGAVAGGVAVFQATALAVHGAGLTGVLLGQALVLAVLAWLLGRTGPLLAAGLYGVIGLGLAVFHDAPVRALVTFPSEPYLSWQGVPNSSALLTGLTLSVLVTLLAIAVLVAGSRLRLVRADVESAWLWAPVGAIGLYGAAGVVLTATLLAVPRQAGFVGGHALVTISWTLIALALLARGIRRPVLRVAGLVLVAAAVAKLFLFDLVALDGLARVAAFVGAGLLLLAAGSGYARLVRSHR